MLQSDYELLANHAIDRHFSDGVDFDDSVIKIAEKNDLNPEQIKRVVELVNTKAFLKMFNKDGAKGKDIDFKVADPKKIMGKIYGESTPDIKITVSKTCDTHENSSGFHNTLKEILGQAAGTAEELTSPLFENSENATPKRHVVIIRMQKVAENLKEQIMEKEATYCNGMEFLTRTFKKMYSPSFLEFEKNAFLLHGSDAKIPMEDLRGYLKFTDDPEEIEKIAGTHIVEDSSEIRVLSNLISVKLDQSKYAEGIKIAMSTIKELSA